MSEGKKRPLEDEDYDDEEEEEEEEGTMGDARESSMRKGNVLVYILP